MLQIEVALFLAAMVGLLSFIAGYWFRELYRWLAKMFPDPGGF